MHPCPQNAFTRAHIGSICWQISSINLHQATECATQLRIISDLPSCCVVAQSLCQTSCVFHDKYSISYQECRPVTACVLTAAIRQIMHHRHLRRISRSEKAERVDSVYSFAVVDHASVCCQSMKISEKQDPLLCHSLQISDIRSSVSSVIEFLSCPRASCEVTTV